MAINLALTLTLDGRDAFWNSGNTGVKLDITHLQFGTRNRLPTGEESFLSLPKQSVKIQNGNKIGPDQVRIMATMPGIENYNVTEIGLWSGEPGIVGSILVAYTSVRTGFIAQMVAGIDLVFTYDMVIDTADIDNITIVKDTDQSSTFALLAEHETDRNAHPFYVTTDTAQTISGAKTFTNKAIFSGGLTGELTGNAATATQLKTPRTIGGVSFNGTANINLPGVNIAGNQNTSGNAATASKLAAAVLVGGIAFDGSAAINLPGVNIAGNQNTSGNAATASKLAAARTISLTGDATGSISFDGSANAAAALTLANTGIAAGTYKSITVDAKGRATAGNDVVTGLVTAATAAGTANAATSNTNTFLNITEKVGAATASAGTSTQITGAGTVTVGSDAAGKITITGAQSITGNAATATKLQTPRAINGVNFDGSANITVYDATKLPTAGGTLTGGLTILGAASALPLNVRGIQGISNSGSITPGLYLNYVDQTARTYFNGETHYIEGGTYTGNAATASKLAAARTISLTGDATGSLSFDGSANAAAALTLANTGIAAGTYKSITVDAKGRATAGNDVVTGLVTAATAAGTANAATSNTNTFLNITEKVGAATASAGTSTQITGAGTVTVGSDAAGKITITGAQSITGNAATATKLQTPRTINGTAFDGSFNIKLSEPTFTGYLSNHLNSNHNSIIDDGGFVVRYAPSGATASPPGTDHAVMSFAYSSLWAAQQAYDWRTNSTYTRTKNNGVWTGWSQLATTEDNVASANKLKTARTISLTGNATGSTTFDGSGNVSIDVNVGDDTHNHTNLATLATYSRVAADLPSAWPMGVSSVFVNSGVGYPTYGGVLNVKAYGNGGGTLQVYTPYGTGHGGDTLAVRFGNYNVNSGNSWTEFKYLIHDKNIDNYAPGKTGVGASGTWGISITGNAATASKLAAARTISLTGDATGSLSFDGSANAAAALTLANSGIAAGTYKSITVDAKGRATAGNDVVTGLVTAATAAGTANAATSNTNTFLNITEKVGAATASAGTSTQITGAGTVTVASDTAGKITITGAQSITGNAATATALATARTIGGVSFNGTANINLPGVNTTGNQSTTGNAATATKLQTPRAINGVNFDGTAAINLPLIGYGQTWQDVTALRARDTVYINSTGSPIMISLYGETGGRSVSISNNGVDWINVGGLGGSGDRESISIIVPDGHRYMLAGAISLDYWVELR